MNPNTERVKQIWEQWNIRGAVLFSLFLQVVLILFAPARKRTGNKAIILLMWLAYLLADAVANFAIGLIVNSQRCPAVPSSPNKENQDLLAFWAPFLLVHLGGPDTITAFSLEDNQLWPRHLLAFFVQSVATLYVFLQISPNNKLVLPTWLLFGAGFIKYLERTFSLYLASKEKFRNSLLRKPEAGVDYARLMEEYGARIPDLPVNRRLSMRRYNVTDVLYDQVLPPEIGLVLRAHGCFNLLKGLIVDLPIRESEHRHIHSMWHDMTGERAFRMIEVELNFFYEVFYTKAVVVHSNLGILCRSISFVSVAAAALVFRFHVKKHGFFDAFDVRVTYTLLCGALALETFALLMACLSDWTLVGALQSNSNETHCTRLLSLLCDGIVWLYSKLVQNRPKMEADQRKLHVLAAPCFSRRWSGYVSGFNLIRYCLGRRPTRKRPAKYCSCYQRFDVSIQALTDAYIKLIAVLFFWVRTPVYDPSNSSFILVSVDTAVKRAFKSMPVHKALERMRKALEWMGLKDLLNELRYKSNEPLTFELWEFIMQELLTKSKLNSIDKLIDARGEWVLENDFESEDCTELISCIVDVTFDESLLLWHIATELLYKDKKVYVGDDSYTERHISKIVSDYMLYLLIMRPTMTEAVSSSDQILRFQDTCAEAIRFFKLNGIEPTEVKTACKKTVGLKMEIEPKEVKGEEESMSVFFKANMLAQQLRRLKEKKWKVMSKVWIEMLSYAASHCSSGAHAQQISNGGELITFVWLAMAHYGLTGKQFKKER